MPNGPPGGMKESAIQRLAASYILEIKLEALFYARLI